VPAVVVLAGVGWQRLVRKLPKRIGQILVYCSAVAVAALLGATASARSNLGNRTEEERVELGHWVAAHYPLSTRIMTDAYTYLPPHFSHVRGGGPPLHRKIEREKAELVIL